MAWMSFRVKTSIGRRAEDECCEYGPLGHQVVDRCPSKISEFLNYGARSYHHTRSVRLPSRSSPACALCLRPTPHCSRPSQQHPPPPSSYTTAPTPLTPAASTRRYPRFALRTHNPRSRPPVPLPANRTVPPRHPATTPARLPPATRSAALAPHSPLKVPLPRGVAVPCLPVFVACDPQG